MTAINDIVLGGCSPSPISKYLVGLGTFRLVYEQADPGAMLYWQQDRCVLRTSLSRDDLLDLLLKRYAPTPIIAPWNGGSGFFENDTKVALTSIASSQSHRFASYRTTISMAQGLVDTMGGKKPGEKEKEALLKRCRSALPDDVVEWLDAAFVLTGDGARYPPLLGTGGNDGRLEFTNNFMQRICEAIDTTTGLPTTSSRPWLISCLFGEFATGLIKGAAIGQFHPLASGGANAGQGFDAASLVNPWEYILMMEGSLLFATGLVKKLESTEKGELSYPFTVKPSSIGYGSAAQAEEGSIRAELWLPLWDAPTTFPDVKALFAEGRAQVGGRRVKNGLDFARAVATLGVDRGVSSFTRSAFMERNGMNYFSVPLGRFQVTRRPQVELLDEIDRWMLILHERMGKEPPSSMRKAVRSLDEAVLRMCQDDDPASVQEVLISLGRCELALNKSFRWANDDAGIRPIPFLSHAWLEKANDGTSEFRLAASLATLQTMDGDGQKGTIIPIRSFFEPIKLASSYRTVSWADGSKSSVNILGHPLNVLNELFANRLVRSEQAGLMEYGDSSTLNASLSDINAFIEGRTDDRRLIGLLAGAMLVDGREVDRSITRLNQEAFPGAAYSLLKLCFAGRGGDNPIPIMPEIHRKAAAGDMRSATKIASRRLIGSTKAPMIGSVDVSPPTAERIAASLIFPIDARELSRLKERTFEPQEDIQ